MNTRTLSLLPLLLTLLTSPPTPPPPMPRAYRAYLPLVAVPHPIAGPGVAGGAADQLLDRLGVTWDYSWESCHGVRRCLPMWRTGWAWYPGYTVDELMRSCGPEPCLGLLILNEPEWQDNCEPACQAAALHDRAPEALALNPRALVIFANYLQPDPTLLDQLAAAWTAAYPAQDLGAFLRQHNARIGVHWYAWPDYDPDVWRWRLLRFRSKAQALWSVDIALTEYGALQDPDLWLRVIADQAPWLLARGILAAPYIAAYAQPEDARWGCCPLWDNGALTPHGALYAGLVQRWDR